MTASDLPTRRVCTALLPDTDFSAGDLLHAVSAPALCWSDSGDHAAGPPESDQL